MVQCHRHWTIHSSRVDRHFWNSERSFIWYVLIYWVYSPWVYITTIHGLLTPFYHTMTTINWSIWYDYVISGHWKASKGSPKSWGMQHCEKSWYIEKEIPAWISNHMPCEVWDEITYPFPNINSFTVEVWKWMNNFIAHFNYCNFINPG